MRAIGAVATLFAFTTAAICGDLPQYDIDAQCDVATASTGAARDGLNRMCILMEKQRAKEIAARLDTIDADTLSRCHAKAHASYMVLGGCLGVPSEMRAIITEPQKR